MLARGAIAAFALTAAAWPVAASAQDGEAKPPYRYRVAAGAQLVPDYVGADHATVIPMFGFSRTRKSEFDFSAPDQSFGIPLLDSDAFQAGPAIALQGSRKPSEVGANVPKVKTTIEVGGFAQFRLSPAFRVRGELRKGIGGHKGLVGSLGADFIARDGDAWLFSVGPRVGWANNRYHDAYFSVTPANAAATGLPAYNASSGIPTVGAASSVLYSFGGRWGVQGYVKYDRLINDAADSPIVRAFGSRNQFAGGAALTYTFGG